MRRSNAPWRDGNRVKLLENGEQFYPAIFGAIERAEREVLIETFIWFVDPVGRDLARVLQAAAERGCKVVITVDGYGSPDLTPEFVAPLIKAGVKLNVFDPKPRFLGMRTNLFRRLHRKLCVVDRKIGFVGGLNFSEDHLLSFGDHAKQDYAVEVEGPIVADIFSILTDQPVSEALPQWRDWQTPGRAGNVRALLANRDNRHNRQDIEWHYHEAIRHARKEIIIANAYFFPGFIFLRSLRDAARRGVDVKLILQGNPDKPVVQWATTTFYDYLLRNGVTIHEYCRRPLHGKVAVIDDDWSTVGSFNLDPLSLFLNLEANLIVKDAAFTAEVRSTMQRLIDNDCKALDRASAPPRTIWRQLLSYLVFHLIRRFPALFGWLPAHRPQRTPLTEILPIPEVRGPKTEAAEQKREAEEV
jgi:cardiolipin synthase A/B